MTFSTRASTAFDPAFDVDGMLAGLAKWLRILGCDVAYPRKGPRSGRIFVTAARDKRYPLAVYVTMHTPLAQLKELKDQVGLTFDATLVLSRCLRCNEPVRAVSRDLAIGRVPDEILRRFSSFTQCVCCGRVYWEGSHRARIERRLARQSIECC